MSDIKASADSSFLDAAGRRLPGEIRGGAGTLTIEAGDGSRKKFKMLAYSGGPLALKDYAHPVVVDLAGVTIEAQSMMMLAEHDENRPVGESESITITAGGIEISGYIDASTDDGKLIHAAGKGGFAWEGSIGAPVHAMEEYAKGEKVTVNGRQFVGPLYVARKTTLKETSFVKRGADTGATHVAIAAAHKGDSKMEPKFEAYIKASGFDPATLTEPQTASLKSAFDAAEKKAAKDAAKAAGAGNQPIVASGDVQAILNEFRKETAAEHARVASINRSCANSPDIAAKAISEGWTADKAELEVLRASRPTAEFIHTTPDKKQISASACYEAALCISAGIPENRVGKWFDANVMQEATSPQFRGARLSTLMFETIRAAGMQTRMGSISDETIKTAIRADRKLRNAPPIRAEGFTSLSMSGILSNLANKRMIASYEAAAVVWPFFCAIRDHNDFKVHSRYRLDSTGAMRKLGPDGELKHISLQDATYTNQIDTYGGIIALTRQMQINDDMGAFLQIPDIFGRLARIAPEEAFFKLLLANSTSFFAAGNNNLITGASGVMTAANGIAALTLAETKFSNQVDANNKPILVPPSRMLTGTVNYVPARNIYEGRVKITGANQTEVSQNEHAGKYEPYRSAFVNNTAVKDQDGIALTGQSSTIWWLFADPALRCAIAMAFLNGNQIPTIQSEDTEFDTLGMQWRCFLDFGVGYEDPVAAVQINGA